jgi:guanylate kinase
MKPHLERKEDFQKILSKYQVNDEGKKLLGELKLVLLVSPTSAGRNTLIKELVKSGEYEYIISDTTRPKRENNGVMEQDGVEYWFRTEDEMIKDLEAGEYLEAELIHDQQVSGISLRELRKAVAHDNIAIDEVDHEGIFNIVKAKPDTIAVMILPPSPEEWMDRLNRRSDMTTEEINNRLRTAEKILEAIQERDYYKIVINDDLQRAASEIRDIVEKGVYSAEHHQQGVDLAWKLLSWVKQQLYS